MRSITCRLKGYIQPFERELAFRELSALAQVPLEDLRAADSATDIDVCTRRPAKQIASRVAYWESVSASNGELVSAQSLRESTVNVVRNGIDLDTLKSLLPFNSKIPLPNRRCLRYGPHGIHEYRGKFFPQLVRALLNIADVPTGGLIADPMSGSGTTHVEAKLFGCRGVGLDMNPLSIYLGKTKCELLGADPRQLERAYMTTRARVLEPETRGASTRSYLDSLPPSDRAYLHGWFDAQVLVGLDEIAAAIQREKYAPARNLMWIALSNILRSVSWQKDDDLRVRKEIRLDIEIDPKREFLEELARSIRAVLAFLYQEGPVRGSRQVIREGDARDCGLLWRAHRREIDAVVTSPPYATALPYLDTDRLSLCYLKLLSRPSHRAHDERMIGNREVTERKRRDYWSHFESEGTRVLPRAVTSLIRRIDHLNCGTDAGFRRQNLPALLSKYFFDMRAVLQGIHEVLRSGRFAFVVVGNNHTIAGGERVEISTSTLLAEIAQSVGFAVQQSVPMDMLISRDIFRKNASASEEILVLKKAR